MFFNVNRILKRSLKGTLPEVLHKSASIWSYFSAEGWITSADAIAFKKAEFAVWRIRISCLFFFFFLLFRNCLKWLLSSHVPFCLSGTTGNLKQTFVGLTMSIQWYWIISSDINGNIGLEWLIKWWVTYVKDQNVNFFPALVKANVFPTSTCNWAGGNWLKICQPLFEPALRFSYHSLDASPTSIHRVCSALEARMERHTANLAQNA